MSDVVNAISMSQGGLNLSIDTAKNDIQKQIGNPDHNAETRWSDKHRTELHQRLLDSLSFPDMDQRRINIKNASPGTLDWLYDMQSNPTARPWAHFGMWLRKDSSVYWVSGKAASEKSTLMAHIVDDQRTYDGLREWSPGFELYVLSFYFWRPGSALQSSNVGLLRSLLHQICVFFPAVIDKILKPKSIWTEKSLTTGILNALGMIKRAKFCLFIDGLDEYDGDYDDLLDLLFQLQQLDCIKCCVSSRPETNLRSRLKACDQLRLEDWNR